MPVYAYKCKCGHTFDEMHLSTASVEEAKKNGIKCEKCGKQAKKNSDPREALRGGAFRKYGLWTYQ